MIKEGILKHQERRKNNGMSEDKVNYNFASPFEFSELCLKVEVIVIILFDEVLNVCRKHI